MVRSPLGMDVAVGVSMTCMVGVSVGTFGEAGAGIGEGRVLQAVNMASSRLGR